MNPHGRPAERAPVRLDRQGTASAELVTTLRRQLTGWLRGLGASPGTVSDIELAAYEALANVAVHAYPPGTDGQVDMHASLDGGVVTVTVTDGGRWKPLPLDRESTHGRGLLLIHELAEESSVVPGDQGTTVRMAWALRQPSPGHNDHGLGG